MPKFTFIAKLFTVFAFFWMHHMTAQYNVDSLKTIIANPKIHDTTRLTSIALIIENLYENQESIKYTNLMGKIAQRNLTAKHLNPILHKKYTMYLAAYYNNVGFQLEEKGNLNSLDYLNKSIRLYQSVQANDEVYSSMVSRGLLLSRRKQYKEAIDSYYKALRYFELHESENVDGISYVYSNLGVLYGEQDDYRTAIKYLKKAIGYIDRKAEKISVEDELQKCSMYYNIGAAYVTLKEYDEAIKNLNAALPLARKNNQNSYLSYIIAKLGFIDMQNNRWDEAEKKLIEAKALSDSDLSKSFTLVKLGELYFYKKDYKKAEAFLYEGLASSKKIRKSDLQQQSYELLYKISKIKGDYKKSVEMLELFHKIEDSTKVEENKNELEEQQLKYNYEKKELNYKLITERKNAAKNNLLLLLSSAIILLLIGAYFLYRNYKHKQTIDVFEKNDLKQKLLLTQMNPHFIFNSIDNIQSLIYNKQDKEAVSYLAKFSKLTRQILENSDENYITLAEELTMIDNYLSIQQLLYNNKFDFTISVDENIDDEVILIPPMLTQPFIENAIKHGFINKESQGTIDINFHFNNEILLFEIADNGIGFSASEKVGENKSLAMKITKERLKNISKKIDFEVQVQNIFDADNNIIGAKVFFEIPYIYEN